MNEINPDVMRRISKVLALAEQGVGGEKLAAESMLAKMLQKHGLTMDDIMAKDAKRDWVEFTFAGEHEHRILLHIVAKVLDSSEFDSHTPKKTRTKRYYKLTPAEHVEVDFMFDILKAALHQELDKMTTAFIHKNRLYPSPKASDDDAGEPDKELSPEEKMRLKQIAAMMATMAPVQINKAIGHSKKLAGG